MNRIARILNPLRDKFRIFYDRLGTAWQIPLWPAIFPHASARVS